MNWQNANLQLPPSIASVGDALGDVIGGAGAEVASISTRLGALTGTAFTPGGLASAAVSAVSARLDFDSLIGSAITYCCVHPFQFGVKEQDSSGFYLSFPNAIAHLAGKLLDTQDAGLPNLYDGKAALALSVSDSTLQGFSNKLQLLNAWFPVPQMLMAQRRAGNLLQQESKRYEIPPAAQSPAFEQVVMSRMPSMRFIQDMIDSRVSMAESYNAENVDPIAELASVVAEKQAHATAKVDEYEWLTGLISGSPCQALYVTGSSPIALQTALTTAADGNGFDHAFTAMLLFLGSPASLTVLREFFGVDA